MYVDPERKELGVRLRRARQDAGLDVTRVAKRFGVSNKTVYAWETGLGLPSALRLGELCQLYRTSAEYLFGGPSPSLDAEIEAIGKMPEEQKVVLIHVVEFLVMALRRHPPVGGFPEGWPS